MQRLRTAVKKPMLVTHRSVRVLWDLQNRERERLQAEITQARGLMPLPMKPRNGERWTDDDKRRIRIHLRRLASLSPYLVLLLSPGGFIALPVLAWWLDRRRLKRHGRASQQPAK